MIYLLLGAVLWGLWFSHRYAWWAPTIDLKHPRILMYHMISEPKKGAAFNGLRVSPIQFERQLAWFRDHGWNFVTMSELYDQSSELPEKTVALTFDDGFEDNYTNALPLMKKYGAKGTLYLVADRHDRDWSTLKKAHHNSGELKNEPKLSDAQVKEMLGSGSFELGGHTHTHANLIKLTTDQKWTEIRVPKRALEEQFNTALTSFAYPFGIYSEAEIAIVEEAGFATAVTTDNGIRRNVRERPFELPRLKISGKDSFLAFKLRVLKGRRGLNK